MKVRNSYAVNKLLVATLGFEDIRKFTQREPICCRADLEQGRYNFFLFYNGKESTFVPIHASSNNSIYIGLPVPETHSDDFSQLRRLNNRELRIWYKYYPSNGKPTHLKFRVNPNIK